jgi:hypothetical protein
MSEFTDGVLFLKSRSPEIETAAKELHKPYLIHEVNQKWGGVFVEEFSVTEPAIRRWLLTTSKQAPLFYFQHPADMGWGYNLLRDGNEVASLWVSYDLSWNMAADLAQTRYPTIRNAHVNLPSDVFSGLLDEVKNSEEYIDAINQQYETKNLSEFGIFDISPATITELDDVLSSKWYQNDKFEQVEFFKTKIDIKEMSWISYSYLLRDQK